MKLRYENVRLAFAQIWEPKSVNGEGEPAYSASFIFPKDHAAAKLTDEAMEQIGKEKWGAKWPMVKKELTSKDKLAMHDGDSKANYDGFEGSLYVSARNKSRPTIVDRDRSPLTRADGRPYSGCFVVASVELWPQDNTYGKRINASLRGIQFYKDGESFSGGTPASADEFDELEEEGSLI